MTRRKAVWTLLALALAAVLAVWLSGETEPTYQGKHLSHWVQLYGEDGNAMDARRKAGKIGLEAIGTNAVPWLVRWIQADPAGPSYVRFHIYEFLDRQPNIIRMSAPVEWMEEQLYSVYRRPGASGSAFKVYGSAAAFAIPALSQTLNTTNEQATYAAQALIYIGSESIPSLLAVLNNPKHPHRKTVARDIAALPRGGSNVQPVIEALIRCVEQKVNDDLAMNASWSLAKLADSPESVLPTLTNRIACSRSEVRKCLLCGIAHFYGKSAAAKPILTLALLDPSKIVRETMTNEWLIRQQITAEQLTNSPAP